MSGKIHVVIFFSLAFLYPRFGSVSAGVQGVSEQQGCGGEGRKGGKGVCVCLGRRVEGGV